MKSAWYRIYFLKNEIQSEYFDHYVIDKRNNDFFLQFRESHRVTFFTYYYMHLRSKTPNLKSRMLIWKLIDPSVRSILSCTFFDTLRFFNWLWFVMSNFSLNFSGIAFFMVWKFSRMLERIFSFSQIPEQKVIFHLHFFGAQWYFLNSRFFLFLSSNLELILTIHHSDLRSI